MKTTPGLVNDGFTLAELLIALAILGIIATFAIPKILNTQKNNKFNALTKEAISTVAGAYSVMQGQGAASSTTTPSDVMRFVNYVKNANYTLDPAPTSLSDVGGTPGYLLHGGGVIRIGACSFGGTTALNKVSFLFDPDGVPTGNNDSIVFFLYYNGRITTLGTAPTGSLSSCASASGAPDPSADPNWFDWSH